MSKYEPLRRHLSATVEPVVRLPFSSIDRMLPGGLPQSAYRHQAWWSNSRSHSQAAAWLDAGRTTRNVDLNGRTVEFVLGATSRPSRPSEMTARKPVARPIPAPRAAGQGRRIGLVGCVKEKAAGPRPARDLYTSALYQGRRAYVERSCDKWWILSAEHGLVHPAHVLDPYDLALGDLSRGERRAWSRRVLDAVDEQIAPRSGDTIEFHAGVDYRDFGLADGLVERGCVVENPTEGLAIGGQLRFYRSRT